MNITLRQLAVFVAVYQAQSTTQAAEQLALSQSAVSMALAELEKQLSHRLFERIGKRLVLNEDAKILYPKAMAMLDQANELEHIFQAAQGRLVIGASTTIGNYILPAIMAKFQKRYPHIELSLHIHNTEQIAQGLSQLTYDIGFIEGQYSDGDLISEDWLEDELVLFAAKETLFELPQNKMVDLTMLSQWPLVLRERGSGTRNTMEAQLLAHMREVKLIEIGHSEAIKQAVANDMGIGCLSHYTLNDMLTLKKIQLLELTDIKIKRSLRLVYNRQKHMSWALSLFHDFCREYTDLFLKQ